MNRSTRTFMLRNAFADLAEDACMARGMVKIFLRDDEALLWNHVDGLHVLLAKIERLMPRRDWPAPTGDDPAIDGAIASLLNQVESTQSAARYAGITTETLWRQIDAIQAALDTVRGTMPPRIARDRAGNQLLITAGARRVDPCAACGGEGHFPVVEDDGERTWESVTVCAQCHGTGRVTSSDGRVA